MPPTRPGDLLEVALSFAASESTSDSAADIGVLLCSPQPFLGGDLDNNVVRQLASAIAGSGHPALRFNYRGVGASLDVSSHASRFEYWKAVEEARDHAAVHSDARQAFARAARWFRVGAIGGYSFGAYVAATLASAVAPELPLILIAPPLRKLDFSGLASHRGSKLMVFAGQDALDPAPDIHRLREWLPQARIEFLAEADHFFRGEEPRVAELVREFLTEQPALAPQAEP